MVLPASRWPTSVVDYPIAATNAARPALPRAHAASIASHTPWVSQHQSAVGRGRMVAADPGDRDIVAGFDHQPAHACAGQRVVIGPCRQQSFDVPGAAALTGHQPPRDRQVPGRQHVGADPARQRVEHGRLACPREVPHAARRQHRDRTRVGVDRRRGRRPAGRVLHRDDLAADPPRQVGQRRDQGETAHRRRGEAGQPPPQRHHRRPRRQACSPAPPTPPTSARRARRRVPAAPGPSTPRPPARGPSPSAWAPRRRRPQGRAAEPRQAFGRRPVGPPPPRPAARRRPPPRKVLSGKQVRPHCSRCRPGWPGYPAWPRPGSARAAKAGDTLGLRRRQRS